MGELTLTPSYLTRKRKTSLEQKPADLCGKKKNTKPSRPHHRGEIVKSKKKKISDSSRRNFQQSTQPKGPR